MLGIRSYEGVRGSEHAQAVLRALAMQQTLLFVGCGDGLRDPNFGPFLSWLGAVNRSRETPHYRLALQKDVVALAQEHAPEQRIQIVPYGEDHRDLAPFLEKLVRDRTRPQGTITLGSGGRSAGEAMTPAVSAYLRRTRCQRVQAASHRFRAWNSDLAADPGCLHPAPCGRYAGTGRPAPGPFQGTGFGGKGLLRAGYRTGTCIRSRPVVRALGGVCSWEIPDRARPRVRGNSAGGCCIRLKRERLRGFQRDVFLSF